MFLIIQIFLILQLTRKESQNPRGAGRAENTGAFSRWAGPYAKTVDSEVAHWQLSSLKDGVILYVRTFQH
jgi:hypothetical protein